ncbi:MAG: autotransporter outer membrane beta-barrel domain-containing protein, partial [Methyloceanibacter sp.]
STTGDDHYIDLHNSGILTASVDAIDTRTTGNNSFITIDNIGDIAAGSYSAGIFALTSGNADGPYSNSGIAIDNSGDIAAGLIGIDAQTFGSATGDHSNSGSAINNSGDIAAGSNYSAGIDAQTTGSATGASSNSGIAIVNSGTVVGNYFGIRAYTDGLNSPINIANSGAAEGANFGIIAMTNDDGSDITIVNSGTVTGTGGSVDVGGIPVGSIAIAAAAFGFDNDITIINSGTSKVTVTDGVGVGAFAPLAYSSIFIENRGSVLGGSAGILSVSIDYSSDIVINNTGIIEASASPGNAFFYGAALAGIGAATSGTGSSITITNEAKITAGALGISAVTGYAYGPPIYGPPGDNSPIVIVNNGIIHASNSGILAATDGNNSSIHIINSGTVTSTGGSGFLPIPVPPFVIPSVAIVATTLGDGSAIVIENSGELLATGAGSFGISAITDGVGSAISITNSGAIDPDIGIYAHTQSDNSPIAIDNSGPIDANLQEIFALAQGANSGIALINRGDVHGDYTGIHALTEGTGSPNAITNSGSVIGGYAGILSSSMTGTTIINSGDISAGSFLAIGVNGASAKIFNTGKITGFVALTDSPDTFINQNGGVFETKLTSYFNGGDDLFRNEEGGTVLAATDPKVSEHSSFQGLERFENAGLITMQDESPGDSFRISNTYGGTDLEFHGSGKSTLAVDAFLGKPGSVSDTLTVNGDVSGRTLVKVNNTNNGPGVFNPKGIPVVYVNGNVTGDEFYLKKPIDTGIFDYDLFFRPTGSGIFEFKSFLGADAFVLPQLITAAQDMWHSGSDTWFDRTADLRVLLNGGVSPTAYDPNAKYAEGAPATPGITPAVWVRGAGNWLDREDSETVTAYGRSYKYNLNRDLETIDFQTGIDLGKRGLFSDNDILVFGALGGFVHADLDYDSINRAFDYGGGQVGGYATYLRGGLFVDTLLNVHLLEIDTKTLGFPDSKTLGFPDSLNATTVGLRTDTGYRFGSFNGGAFLEPLATLSVNWADIDGFSLGGNKVSFEDEANVRGRLGLRVGTSFPVWTGTTMEPFVIGSVWGNLTDNNEATLVSTGTTFHLEDNLDDVWGEVSAGVNFFNPTANTSVFAKLDVTFGDDVEGVGGKAGMRVSW